MPQLLALALQMDGWIVRSEIVWAKCNPMPESVTDRPTKSHEQIWMLSKQPRYFFDQEAVRENYQGYDGRTKTEISGASQNGERAHENYANREGHDRWPGTGRNIRSVWEMEQVGRAKWSKHTLNETYFAAIETEEQAYWLGFLYADAHVGERHIDLQLSDKDTDHILRFRDALASSYEPKQTHDGRVRVFISCKRMAEDLMTLGIKSQMRIPDMPDDLVRHFVRGLFDGDGSAWKYLPGGRTKWRYGAEFLGTERILLDIRVLLGLRGKPKMGRGIHRLAVAATDDLARLYEFMYDGATVYLERKRREFPQAQSVAPDVWPIATQPFPEAHFATFPEELVRRCLVAGCPEQVCGECGKARERIVEREPNPGGISGIKGEPYSETIKRGEKFGGAAVFANYTERGFTDCGHNAYRPGIVLDPFMGSGTVALVARKHGRRAVGIELSEDYCKLAAKRCEQLSLLT